MHKDLSPLNGNIGDQADSDQSKVRWLKVCQRSPTTASTSHTGVFETSTTGRSVFLTNSGWTAEDDCTISGFSKWVDVVG